jgi:hypothetical protein
MCDRILSDAGDRAACPCDPQVNTRSIVAGAYGCVLPAVSSSRDSKQLACAKWAECARDHWTEEENRALAERCACHPLNVDRIRRGTDPCIATEV